MVSSESAPDALLASGHSELRGLRKLDTPERERGRGPHTCLHSLFSPPALESVPNLQ